MSDLKIFYENIPEEIKERSDRIAEVTLLLLEQDNTLQTQYGFDDKDEFCIAVDEACHYMDIGDTMGPNMYIFTDWRTTDIIQKITELHPIWSFEIVKKLRRFSSSYQQKLLRDICLFHHEKDNGEGYPFGLAGNDIPFIAQLCGVASDIEKLLKNKDVVTKERLEFIISTIKELPGYSRQAKKCLINAAGDITEFYIRRECLEKTNSLCAVAL